MGILAWGSMGIDSLEWPFEELQLLALQRWLRFSDPEVAACVQLSNRYLPLLPKTVQKHDGSLWSLRDSGLLMLIHTVGVCRA